MFGSFRTEGFCNSVNIVLRIKNSVTHKGEMSLSNCSGYGLAMMGATPNVSLVSHRHVGNDMRAIDAADNSRRIGTLWSLQVATSVR